jgi:formate dehydrogenase subunit delta
MMSNLERLVYMANQIARNFEALGHDQAIKATADHIASFWDPRMKAKIVACLESGADLSPTARAAIATLH